MLPDLSGGDPARGQKLFSGDQARCSQCHTFRGQGGKVGPDLTEIGKKGRAEIYRSIAAPSASIEPDYTSFTVATKDGQVVVGRRSGRGAKAIRVTDTNARSTVIAARAARADPAQRHLDHAGRAGRDTGRRGRSRPDRVSDVGSAGAPRMSKQGSGYFLSSSERLTMRYSGEA